jgi:hypothetical protein
MGTFLCFASVLAWGQSIAPPIAEYRGSKVSGMFEIRNTTGDAMAVTLDTKTFTVDERGQVHYGPLAQDVKVQMGSSSFVLSAHDKRMVFYRVSFPSSPASFSIVTTMTKAQEQVGMRVKFVLPHMIYVYQKEKLKRSDVSLDLGNGVLRIHNLSPKLGRVSEVLVDSGDVGGFPIYPNQIREVAVAKTTRASVKFDDGFSLSAR